MGENRSKLGYLKDPAHAQQYVLMEFYFKINSEGLNA
jgi:hypothetical protein